MKTEIYIKCWFPGIFLSHQSSIGPVEFTDPKVAMSRIEKSCYAFQFVEKIVQQAILENGETIEHIGWKDIGKRYFPGGKIYDEGDVKREVKGNENLLENMRINEWPLVVKTRLGNFQPYHPDEDEII